MEKNRKTPGVYITELDAFPNSVIGVATDIPAFIGYTQQATYDGKSVKTQAVQITSLADYNEIFGAGPTTTCTIVPNPDATKADFVANNTGYNLQLTPNTVYNLYSSIQLFYANGGGICYVVSVGGYDAPISEDDIKTGLAVAEKTTGLTMLVVPDAVLLPTEAAFTNVCNAMLAQCDTLQDRVAILDVYNGATPFAADGTNPAINVFWETVTATNLSYGMVYFPFLNTSINTIANISYTQFLNTDVLAQILAPQLSQPFSQLQSTYTVAELNQYLQNTVPLYTQIANVLLAKLNVLPPSAAMAGVYTMVDNNQGVWNAPANVKLNKVSGPTVPINNTQQDLINVPLHGKAINALRAFTGRGTVVWGARTLDANSNDWRYIQVRRTLIYIEQSIKNALSAYVFSPNTPSTWVSVKSMISNFLTDVWKQGGLMGSRADEAYTVQVGLGSTMIPDDIINGYMIVNVTLQMVRPAEFIELTFKQTMQGV
jgi:uncharacterized protein